MDIRYVNHKGVSVDLMTGSYKISDSSLFSYSWNYDSNDAVSGYGGKIDNFRKGVQTKELVIHIEGIGMKTYKQAYDALIETFEVDVVDEIPGKLYVDDDYIECYITECNQEYFIPGVDACAHKFKLASAYPLWIMEAKRAFQKITNRTSEETYLDYEYDYGYDYTMTNGGDVIWHVDHYAPCEYEMVIYGPCVDPSVVINGHTYKVYATLDDNDYMIINSRGNSVVQYLSNGAQRDLYDYRAKTEDSLFEPITAGNVRVVWSGGFGFDLTLFCERSEPRWKTKDG